MKNRFEIGFRGGLYSLPFVVLLPMVFWIAIAPTQMIQWSWAGLFDLYRWSAPFLLLSAGIHSFGFLIFGFPLFAMFWQRKSTVWSLPGSIGLGFGFGSILGLPAYYNGGFFNTTNLLVCLGYGVATGFGCWAANLRNCRFNGKAGHS